MTMTGHTDDRGQLILAGAVVFSLVLIGIVVVFSTTLFTANMASSSTNAGITDAGGLESDVEATVEDLIEAYNDDEVDNFDNEVQEYAGLLADRHAESGPVITDVNVVGRTDDNGDIETAEIEIVYETRSVTTERTVVVGDDS